MRTVAAYSTPPKSRCQWRTESTFGKRRSTRGGDEAMFVGALRAALFVTPRA